jgi:anti-sigma factor RsiW
MSCDKTTQVHAYHDGELLPQWRARFQAHLNECAECRDLLAELRTISELVAAAPMVELPPQAMARFAGSWRAASDRLTKDRGVLRIAGWLTTAAAAVLLGALYLGHQETDEPLRSAGWQAAAVMPPTAETRDDSPSDLVMVAQWMANDLSPDQPR